MAKPYSQDSHNPGVIDAVERGELSRRAAARRYEVSKSVAIKWLERVERNGSARACRARRSPGFQADAAPGLSGSCTDREAGHHVAGALRSATGRAGRQGGYVDDEPLLSPDRRHGQKKTLVAREQDRPDISRHRKRWRTYQGLIDPRRLVFIDETWTKTNMTRLRGWAPRGERLVDKVPQGKWKTATFLAALRNDRIDAPCLFDGPINGERFHAYVEQFLVPTLKPGNMASSRRHRLPQGKGCATNDPQCWGASRLPAEILVRPQFDRAGLRQVQNPAAKGRCPKIRRSRQASARSSPSTRATNEAHTSGTQDTRQPKRSPLTSCHGTISNDLDIEYSVAKAAYDRLVSRIAASLSKGNDRRLL